MDDCPYKCHPEMMQRLRECEDAKVRSEDNSKKVDILFTYHDEMRELIQSTKEALIKLTESHHHWSGDITRQINSVSNELSGKVNNLSSCITANMLDYGKFKEDTLSMKDEFKSFAWFRGPVNRIKEKSPWLLSLVILIAVGLFILGYEGMKQFLGIFKTVVGWFK